MRDHSLINQAIVGIYLGDPHTAGDGEITFGDTNPARYQGDIRYLPITSEKYWEVPFNGVRIGNSTVSSQSAQGQPAANKAVVDTGTTLIIVPPSLSRVIHEAVPGAIYNESTGGWRVPCASEEDVKPGATAAAAAIELVRQRQTEENKTLCHSGVSETQSSMIIMGDTFLRHYYSVYDYDKKRIGFAPVAH